VTVWLGLAVGATVIVVVVGVVLVVVVEPLLAPVGAPLGWVDVPLLDELPDGGGEEGSGVELELVVVVVVVVPPLKSGLFAAAVGVGEGGVSWLFEAVAAPGCELVTGCGWVPSLVGGAGVAVVEVSFAFALLAVAPLSAASFVGGAVVATSGFAAVFSAVAVVLFAAAVAGFVAWWAAAAG
jgi:hypothetical protein